MDKSKNSFIKYYKPSKRPEDVILRTVTQESTSELVCAQTKKLCDLSESISSTGCKRGMGVQKLEVKYFLTCSVTQCPD